MVEEAYLSKYGFPDGRTAVVDNNKLLKHLNLALLAYKKSYPPFLTPNLCVLGLNVVKDCVIEGDVKAEDAMVLSTNTLIDNCSIVVTDLYSGIMFLQQPISIE